LLPAHAQLVRKFERGDIPKLEWLDRLTFKEIERVHAVRDSELI